MQPLVSSPPHLAVPTNIDVKPNGLGLDASSTTSSDTPTNEIRSAGDNGALSMKWNIPPRPKPGRKPSINTPPSKRKAQNREAQRAFRERRAAREDELKEEQKNERQQWHLEKQQIIAEFTNTQRSLQQALSAQVAEKESWMHSANEEKARARASIEDKNRQIDHLRAELEQLQLRSSISSNVTNLPLVDSATNHTQTQIKADEDMEIDFTTSNPGVPSSESQLDGLISDSCGFCTDPSNCICKSEAEASELEMPEMPMSHSYGGSAVTKLPILEPPGTAKGPSQEWPKSAGTCSDCLADPVRRQFCQRLATIQPSTQPTLPSPQSTIDADDKSLQLRSIGVSKLEMRPSMTCSETFDCLSRHLPNFGQKQDSYSFMEQFKAYPSDASRNGDSSATRTATAYEVDCASVLTAMARSGARP